MRMTGFFGCLIEQKLRGIMSSFENITRESAVERVRSLSNLCNLCDLHVNRGDDIKGISPDQAAGKIKELMNRWESGVGTVSVSEGYTPLKSRIVVKHYIPGETVQGGPGGSAHYFSHNEYYEVRAS